MSHLVSNQPWGDIDLDTTQGRIFLQQKWFYNWFAPAPLPPWTVAERRLFHNRVDRQIWGSWSNRIRLRVAGSTPFCRQFAASGVPINFDVKWVLTPGHWTVNVRKMPAGSSPTSYVSNVVFASRTINLDSADLASYAVGNAAGASNPRFQAVPHEFGHTFYNLDEYNAVQPNWPMGLGMLDPGAVLNAALDYLERLGRLADSASLLNIGSQIRARHLQLVVDTLNALTPGCVWSAP